MNAEEHINRYSIKNDRKLNAICSPLNLLGIDCFWHHTITEEGYFSYIGNVGSIAEYFFHHRLHINHPAFRSPKLLRAGIVLPTCDTLLERAQEPIKDRFHMDQLMIISKNEGSNIKGFCFATTHNDRNMLPIYVKNLTLLKKFIHYFIQETDFLIGKTYENRVNVSFDIGEYFHSLSSDEIDHTEHKFLKLLGETVPLSKRELECVQWLVYGLSASQIALKLNLSKRTVEHYLENVKNKWGCINKQELVERAILETLI